MTFSPSRSTPEAIDAGPQRLIWMSTAVSYSRRSGYAVGFGGLLSVGPGARIRRMAPGPGQHIGWRQRHASCGVSGLVQHQRAGRPDRRTAPLASPPAGVRHRTDLLAQRPLSPATDALLTRDLALVG